MAFEEMSSTVLLLGLVGWAVVSDLRHHRIPNLLVLLGLALGLVNQASLVGGRWSVEGCIPTRSVGTINDQSTLPPNSPPGLALQKTTSDVQKPPNRSLGRQLGLKQAKHTHREYIYGEHCDAFAVSQ